MVGLVKNIDPRERRAAIRKENANFFDRMFGENEYKVE